MAIGLVITQLWPKRAHCVRPTRQEESRDGAAFHRSVQRRGAFVSSPPSVYCSPSFRSPGEETAQAVISKSCRNSPVGHPSIFEVNRAILLSTLPILLDAIAKTPAERHNHFSSRQIDDSVGLPRNYKSRVNNRQAKRMLTPSSLADRRLQRELPKR